MTGKIHAILLTPVNEKIGESVADVARTRPGFHFARECLPPFAEIRPRPTPADKGLFRSLRTIQLDVALAQGRRLCGTTWVTSNIDVTQNCQPPKEKP